MENLYHFLGIIFFIFLTIKLLTQRKQNLPPSPFTLPIVGHLHLIKNPLYQSLETLSSKYGPVLFLRFGCRRVLVISSPSAVEECFNKNDIIFANRPRTMAGDLLTYNYVAFVWAPYGPLWRNLRRLSVVEIFSSKSVQRFSSIREEEVANFIRHLFKVSAANGTQKVDLKYLSCLLTTNVMLRVVAGRRGVDDATDMEAEEKVFLREFKNIFFPNLATNICDFFPILRRVGFKGIEKNMRELHRRREEYIRNLVDEIRLRKTSSSADVPEIEEEGKNPSLIEKLLSIQEEDPDFCSNEVIKSMALMMFVAGTETTAVTMEWAMSLLLNHPEALQKPIAGVCLLPLDLCDIEHRAPTLDCSIDTRRVLVVSSPSAIEECFTKNDIIFANRPQTMAGDILTDKYVTIAWAPYGDLWRNLRRLIVVEIFSANSLQRVRSIREEEVRNCVQQLSKL
ncbi:hypothetical protein POUND7_017891 [Theobroma cacao]